MGHLLLPPRPGDSQPIEWSDVSSVVIIGANGSGKSRLGAWVDSMKQMVTHRVSAQRSLVMSEFVPAKSREQSQRIVLYGHEEPHAPQNKLAYRWQEKPTSHMLSDYDMVLSYAFADHAATAVKFRDGYLADPAQPPPVTRSALEIALTIWRSVLPHRELVLEDYKVTAKAAGGASYRGIEMSDGERVVLYLILQCLAAPPNAVVILDEPELHLHRAIQTRLWDQVEVARPDCVFVYVTHDLDFAASRRTARKVWVRGYDGKQWDWEEVPTTDAFPEPLTLQILGSRQPILFVEGERESLDTAIYQTLFPARHVIARSSCDNVLQSTCALRGLTTLHHTEACGLIDRDHRSDEQLTSFTSQGVFTLDVAEVEHLFLVPEVVHVISAHLDLNPASTLAVIQDFAFGALRDELAVQVNARAVAQLRLQLNSVPRLSDRKGGAADFTAAVNDHLRKIDPAALYADSERLYRGILDKRAYPSLLKHYNRKSLAGQVSPLLGLRADEYPRLVLRRMKAADGEPLRTAMRRYIPALPSS